MSKPEDISQEAWDAACAIAVSGYRKSSIVDDPNYLVGMLARAITAATLAEREACAALVETHRDTQTAPFDDWTANVGKRIAAAIRKRREP